MSKPQNKKNGEIEDLFCDSIPISIPMNTIGREYLEMAFDRCIKCSTCKYGFKNFEISCPSGTKHLFESYWASGRIRTARGVIRGDLEWNDELKHSIFACTTCGSCMNSCQAPHAEYIVDIIESLREMAVKNIGPATNQEKLAERVMNPEMRNPYGEQNSDNSDLKKQYSLPEKAEWVYFIGCTSNYRQKKLRDATLRLLKKIKISFTLIDEYCCTSPLLRTGQVQGVKDIMEHNLIQIKHAEAKNVITSCAGCYRTLNHDFKKHEMENNFRTYHIIELLNQLLTQNKIRIKGTYKKTVTYHDPCHLGRHMGIYDLPRRIYKSIPGLKLVEMKRNKEFAWCCGAGGGVKIGYPDWALEISDIRIHEALDARAEILSSTCPFCKTNLGDANDKNNAKLEVLDLIEILDQLDIEFIENNEG